LPHLFRQGADTQVLAGGNHQRLQDAIAANRRRAAGGPEEQPGGGVAPDLLPRQKPKALPNLNIPIEGIARLYGDAAACGKQEAAPADDLIEKGKQGQGMKAPAPLKPVEGLPSVTSASDRGGNNFCRSGASRT